MYPVPLEHLDDNIVHWRELALEVDSCDRRDPDPLAKLRGRSEARRTREVEVGRIIADVMGRKGGSKGIYTPTPAPRLRQPRFLPALHPFHRLG